MPVLKPLVGSGDAPQQHNQPSRKGKKAWRKNVDITEVQDGLEALNEEIIRGGVTAEKPSDELFTVDTVGDLEKASSSKKRGTKTLRSDEIIAQRSAVPAVSLRKRPAKTSDGLLPIKRQRRDPWVTHAEVARLRRVADGQEGLSVVQKDATYDVWGAPPNAPKTVQDVVEHEEDNWVAPEEKAKTPKSMRLKPVSLAASGKAVPSVAKPSGAYSYNPLFEDYASRLQAESDKAVEAEKQRLAQEEAELIKAEARVRSAAEADAAEKRAQLAEWDEDSAWEGFETDAEEDGASGSGIKKQPKRKSTTQKNRVKRRKLEEGRQKHEAAMKARDRQAEKIRQIAIEIAERDAHRQALALQAGSDESGPEDVSAGDVRLRRKKLGKVNLPEGNLELVLPEDLRDSLRLLKPEGNLLTDRYRTMLVQGRVESRRRIPFKKKPNVKFTEKWSYKDFRI